MEQNKLININHIILNDIKTVIFNWIFDKYGSSRMNNNIREVITDIINGTWNGTV